MIRLLLSIVEQNWMINERLELIFSLSHSMSIKAYKRVKYFPYDNHLDQRCSWDDNLSTKIMQSKGLYYSKKYVYDYSGEVCMSMFMTLSPSITLSLSLFYVTLQYWSRYFTMKTEVERQGSTYHTYRYNKDDTRFFSNYYAIKKSRTKKFVGHSERHCRFFLIC